MTDHFRLLTLLFLLSFAACSKRESPQAGADLPSPGQEPVIDACALLTSEEIKSVQGESPTETKPSTKTKGGSAISQCYFALPTFTNSISLMLVRNSPGPDGRDTKQVWKEIFPPEKLQLWETADGKKKLPPERISDLGDEAFWTGGPAGGLYVLKGNSYIRISIGGSDDQETKIKKLKGLAEMVLKRL
jgi:hypothetical protein